MYCTADGIPKSKMVIPHGHDTERASGLRDEEQNPQLNTLHATFHGKTPTLEEAEEETSQSLEDLDYRLQL